MCLVVSAPVATAAAAAAWLAVMVVVAMVVVVAVMVVAAAHCFFNSEADCWGMTNNVQVVVCTMRLGNSH